MMGVHQSQAELFTYSVQLDKRVRPDHPLRQIAALVDFAFVRAETARFYGRNGNVSIDPAVILKLMFLLFFDNVASERELMDMLAERLDYLWFLGFGLDDSIPDHSVLSKARSRWGKDVFESFFVRVVQQCVEKGLVDGQKIHVDSSLIDAHASKDSVRKGPPELIAALKAAYQAQESKLAHTACLLRSQCTRSKMGRTLHRHEQQEMLDQARQQSHSWQGRRDRKRRQQFIEQSFADAANNHGFKRSRWRRLWRQQIQDYMIAAIQNLRLLVKHGRIQSPAAAAGRGAVPARLLQYLAPVAQFWHRPSVREKEGCNSGKPFLSMSSYGLFSSYPFGQHAL
jgi:transposase